MVLELVVPNEISINSLMSQFPVLFAYLISFSLIYLAWRSHHNAFEKAEVINDKIFVINGIWLFFITLIPFTTALVGNDPHNPLSESIYVLVLILWVLSFQLLDISITKSNPDAPKDEVRGTRNRILLFGGYFLALIFAFVLPFLSVVIIGVDVLIMGLGIFLDSKNN